MPSRVYVIELGADVGDRRDPRIPWVYVGSSARDPEVRFQQHLGSYKHSRLVKRFGLRLRPDLFDDLEPFSSSDEALAAEHQRARQLARCGFVAHCDGISHGAGNASWSEWGARRLSRVIEHIDDAIAELSECSFRPLTPKSCAHLLHGTQRFWVSDYIDLGDPPPSYGLFAHVRRDLLAKRAGTFL